MYYSLILLYILSSIYTIIYITYKHKLQLKQVPTKVWLTFPLFGPITALAYLQARKHLRKLRYSP